MMHIIVKANAEQKEEFLLKGVPEEVRVDFSDHTEIVADAYFDLCYEEEGLAFTDVTNKPVFVNAVIDCSDSLSVNCIRINGWNGFLKRELVEIFATDSQIFTDGVKVLETLKWKYQPVADVPGMIAA